MIDILLEPFTYGYMTKAIWVSALVGGSCGFLSCYLMLKGWSLIGDALSHSIVPGVALAYIINIPFAFGAFFSGLLAAAAMQGVKQTTKLREDAVIGLIFTSFFAIGMILNSLYPISVNIQHIILGNILGISDYDAAQLAIICGISLSILTLKWKDFMIVFFDSNYAQTQGVRTKTLTILFFTILSATCVAALQTVGACLVIAMVITPGAIAYLLTNKFNRLLLIAIATGTITSAFGAYISFFIDAHPGGLIVSLQTFLFLLTFLFSPRHGLIAKKKASAI